VSTWSTLPDPSDLARHLAEVEGEIAQSERRIAEQRASVAVLQQGGHDLAEAELLLGELERLLDGQLARRDAIVRSIDLSSRDRD
jgi:hypothetical protein